MTPGFERIDRVEDLDAIEDEWRLLFERAGTPSPFLDFDWVRMCFARLEQTAQVPMIACVRDGGKLSAALPLMRVANLLALRRHDAMHTLLPQSSDVLIAHGDREGLWLEGLFRGLGRDWRSVGIALDRVPATSALLNLGKEQYRSSRIFAQAAQIELSGSFEDFLATLSASARSQYRRKRRDMERNGGVRLRCSTAETLEADLDWALARKREWTPREGKLRSWLTSPEAEADFRHIASKWTETGRFALYLLEIGGARAAARVAFRVADRMTCYFNASDPKFLDYSPGRVLLLDFLATTSRAGVTLYDLMPPPSEWKDRIKTGDSPVHKLRLKLRR